MLLYSSGKTEVMDRRGGGGGGGRKTLLAPIHFIFKLLQQRSTVSIWLYEQTAVRIEGKIRVRAICDHSEARLTRITSRDSTNS